MADDKVKKTPSKAKQIEEAVVQSYEELKTRIEAILHSHGYDGTVAAAQITEAVSAHVGADITAPAETPAPAAPVVEAERTDAA